MDMSFFKAFCNQSFGIPEPTLTEDNLPCQKGTVHIVTGGYAGVGLELTRILYHKGARVYVVGRSKEKAESAIKSLQAESPQGSGELEFLRLDLANLPSIKDAVAVFTSKEDRLDVLVNNAGIMVPQEGSTSPQGHELQMATNCLGPFLLTSLLYPLLRATAAISEPGSVRVTWAASIAIHSWSPPGGVQFDSMSNIEVFKDQHANYGQSKAGNLYYAAEFHRRFSDSGVVNVAFNPGNLVTELQRNLGFVENLGVRIVGNHPRFGAYTELYSGWSSDITSDMGGTYIIPWGRIGSDPLRADMAAEIDKARTDDDAAPRKFWRWSMDCIQDYK